MKKPIILSLFLLFPLLSFSQTGYLDIKSTPSGAQVYINGSYRATTPEVIELTVGSYRIEIRNTDYESEFLNIRIPENQVIKHNIILKETSGFVEKREETRRVDQAKGNLTIISDPDDAEIWVGDEKATQHTPATLYELGAGYHTVRVSNLVKQPIIGTERLSIKKSVRIRGNQTELLKISFSDYTGSLSFGSDRKSEVLIENQLIGEVPQKLQGLVEGNKEIMFKSWYGEPINETFTITKEAVVEAGHTKTVYASFNEKFRLAHLEFISNNKEIVFKLNRLYPAKTQTINSGFSSAVIASDYVISWGNDSNNVFSFAVEPDKIAEVFVPVPRPEKELFSLTSLEGYISRHDYASKDGWLPESKRKNYIRFRNRLDDYDIRGHVGVSTLALLSSVPFFIAAAMDNTLYAIGGALFAVPSIIFYFNTDSKRVDLPKNIKANRLTMNKHNAEYDKKLNVWEKKLSEKNKPIIERNKKIKEYNKGLPPASVKHKKM